MSDPDLSAFDALTELASLTLMAKESEKNMATLRAVATKYRDLAGRCGLQRPRAALLRLANELDAGVNAAHDFAAAVSEEGKVLEERLRAVAVKQADLDEIAKRRAKEANNRPASAEEVFRKALYAREAQRERDLS